MRTNDKLTAKLDACEASMRRWHSRLTRATNALGKLQKQRRRLMAQMAIANMTAPPGQPTPNQIKAIQEAKQPKPQVETDHIAELDLPTFLDRRNPDGIRKAAMEMQEKADAQLVDKLKAKRAASVEADKKKMPLTGKAALDAIKPKRKAAQATKL